MGGKSWLGLRVLGPHRSDQPSMWNASLAEVNVATVGRGSVAALARVVEPADEVELRPGATKILPVPTPLDWLLSWPGGIRRGATVAAVGSTSLLMSRLASATTQGWAAYGPT
ncbi:hypothetical protein [Paractinoplanes globisporus]|uniref:Uncharacterized protein n=1 Tax=Paractinoplanes globisporus TaxID=113565 RepID=A0ABW6WIH3_9ACTN|nr:hypothetical protein [Actinoplanes globisporus]